MAFESTDVVTMVAKTERVAWRLKDMGYGIQMVSVVHGDARIVLDPRASFNKLKARFGCETRQRTNDARMMSTTIDGINVIWSEGACSPP